jgi:hypothetical protein
VMAVSLPGVEARLWLQLRFEEAFGTFTRP